LKLHTPAASHSTINAKIAFPSEGGSTAGRSETQLLILAAHPHADQHTREKIAYLARSSIDWTFLWQQAERHGIRPLVYRNLCLAQAAPDMPDSARVAAVLRECATRSLYMLGELIKLLEVFDRGGIPVIPFKGPALAITAYGDIFRREFSDLDILIRECDIHRASQVLAEAGFSLTSSRAWLQPYLSFGHELGFISLDRSFEVDLQWRFAKKWLALPIAPELVWSRSVWISIAGRSVLQPCPEHNLLILCGHGYRHCWSHLKWIVDITAFLHTFGRTLDWCWIAQHAARNGGLRLLGLGLWLAQRLGGPSIPSSAGGRQLIDSRVPRIGETIMRNLFCKPDTLGAHGTYGLRSRIGFHWRTRERLREKLPAFVPLLSHLSYIARRYLSNNAERLQRCVK